MSYKRDDSGSRVLDPAMSLDEAAEALRLSLWTIRKWAADGRLATIKLGRRRVVRTSEIERILSGGVPPKLDASAGS